MDNSDNIDSLIGKFLAGEASPEEAMQLEDWKNLSTDNLKQFKQSEKIFNLVKKQSFISTVSKENAWKKIENKTFYKSKIIVLRPNFKRGLVIAASLLLLVSGYFVIQKQISINKPLQHTFAYTENNKNISFSDETQIELAPGSKIVYDDNYGKINRNISLIGSAYFTVKHNDTLPFIVDLGNVFVKDLGTKFNITLSADTDSIHIKVDEGIVLLFDSASNSIEIKASERAIYIKSSKQILKPEQLNENILNFDKTPLSKVIVEIEEKFGTKIILENSRLNECTISAKFKDEDLYTVLTVIAETLGLTFEKQNENYLIKGKACN
jgi:transmembrane sensor